MKNKLLWLTALILVSVTTIFAQVPTNDLVFQYNLNGNLNETSGNNNGTLAQTGSNLTYIDGIMQQDTNGAVQLNQDQLTNNGNITFTDNVKLFSLSFWFKSAGSNGTNFTLLKLSDPQSNNNFVLRFTNNGARLNPHLQYQKNSSSLTISPSVLATSLLNDQWHNVVVKTAYWPAKNRLYLKVYVDGNLFTEGYSDSIDLNNILIFGGINLETGTAHNYALDNIRFYNRELSDNEITALYDERNETAIQSCTNIVNIPDANLKTALLQHGTTITGSGISTIDTDSDGEICQTEAQAYTGIINVNNKNITNATGLEAFENAIKLFCDNNQLTSLDASSNNALITLSCSNNQLTSLVLPTSNNLIQLYCNNNQLNSLDVSTYNALTYLFCNNNQLTSLNIANGNNANMAQMWAHGNSSLTCIQTDANIVGTTPNDWQKDTGASYSANCASASVNDETFNNAITMYPNPVKATLYFNTNKTIKNVQIFNVLGKKVVETTQKTIDVNTLSSGIYIVKITGENNKIATKKFVKAM